MGGHKPKAIAGEHRIWLLRRIDGKDFTIRGLVAEFAERGLEVDYRSVWNFLDAEKLSFKKKLSSPANAIAPTFARKRAQWKKYQRRIKPERLVFIDETWTKTNTNLLNG
jgi:transposase